MIAFVKVLCPFDPDIIKIEIDYSNQHKCNYFDHEKKVID